MNTMKKRSAHFYSNCNSFVLIGPMARTDVAFFAAQLVYSEAHHIFLVTSKNFPDALHIFPHSLKKINFEITCERWHFRTWLFMYYRGTPNSNEKAISYTIKSFECKVNFEYWLWTSWTCWNEQKQHIHWLCDACMRWKPTKTNLKS